MTSHKKGLRRIETFKTDTTTFFGYSRNPEERAQHTHLKEHCGVNLYISITKLVCTFKRFMLPTLRSAIKMFLNQLDTTSL